MQVLRWWGYVGSGVISVADNCASETSLRRRRRGGDVVGCVVDVVGDVTACRHVDRDGTPSRRSSRRAVTSIVTARRHGDRDGAPSRSSVTARRDDRACGGVLSTSMFLAGHFESIFQKSWLCFLKSENAKPFFSVFTTSFFESHLPHLLIKVCC